MGEGVEAEEERWSLTNISRNATDLAPRIAHQPNKRSTNLVA